MSVLAIDRIPKKQLENRYGIKTTALKDRIKALGIKPVVEGRLSYISGEDLVKLDELHQHLESGGTLTNFSDSQLVLSRSQQQLILSSEAKLARAIEQSNEPFIDLLLLQRFNDSQWLIDTKRLAIILGIKEGTLRKKKTYYHCGFVCTKVGKQRGQNVWQVKLVD